MSKMYPYLRRDDARARVVKNQDIVEKGRDASPTALSPSSINNHAFGCVVNIQMMFELAGLIM